MFFYLAVKKLRVSVLRQHDGRKSSCFLATKFPLCSRNLWLSEPERTYFPDCFKLFIVSPHTICFNVD